MARNPNVAAIDTGFGEQADDPPGNFDLERVNSAYSVDSSAAKSLTRRYMPNSRTFKNGAGKASKAASRGASKMASAFVSTGKKLRFRSTKSACHEGDLDAKVVGAQDESMYILEDNEEDNAAHHNGEDHEDTSYLLYGQKSSYSTPSTERQTDIDGLDRSDHSGGQPSDASATSGSDSDVIGREKSQKVPTVVTKPQPVEWNHKAFQSCRPLSCDTIWDIPTSRLPQPEPRPEPSPVRLPREQQRGKIEAFGSDSLPPLSPENGGRRYSSFGGGRRQLPKLSVSKDLEIGRSPSIRSIRQTQKGPLRTVCVCLGVTCAAGAVIASAMHFL